MHDTLEPDDPQWIDPREDGMHPPTIPQLVECIHCGEDFDSWRMVWQVTRDEDGRVAGWWVCPVDGCDGAGFGIDIHPVDYDDTGTWTDPDGREMHVSFCDDEEDEEFDEDDEDWSGGSGGSGGAGGTGEVRDFDDYDKFDDDDIPF